MMADKNNKSSILTLDSALEKVPGIGPKKFLALKNAGFTCIFDLLRIYPSRYQDRSLIVKVKDMQACNEPCMMLLRLDSIKSYHARRGLTVISAEFSDETGKAAAKWFNRVYLVKQLKPGTKYWLFGQISPGKIPLISNPEIETAENESPEVFVQNGLTPVYPSNSRLAEAKISPLSLRKLIASCLEKLDWEKSFPEHIRSSSFKVIIEAIKQIHLPENSEKLNKAKHTLAFFDQVLFQIGVLKRRENLTGFLTLPDSSKARPFEPGLKLPFTLTNSQKQTLGEIMDDLARPFDQPPMNRLLQGDVGSGKTLVAFLAMIHFVKDFASSAQCVFMAPTEILARQHYINFSKFFPEEASRSAILTGSQKQSEKKQILSEISEGQITYVFGTHALFQEHVKFRQLDLCIIDEQQRFGVNHRRSLFRKGKNPHQLLLSATPIPRTLSLTIFGDMDTSIINELPPGRTPIKTFLATRFHETLPYIKQTLQQNRQVYLVCPLIEFSDKKEWTSVEEAAERIEQLLPETSYACLTGQQTWEEKQQIMQAFKNGDLQIIVATTVVEVGVDNPDATLMIIENADCFGLSQLHQLRGRVGRGSHDSSCFLISHIAENSPRLQLLASTNDGFELSLEDLKLRGPGDLVGTRQSGLSHPCFSHRIPQKLVENARIRAFEILTQTESASRDWFLQQMEKSFGESYKSFMEGG